MNTLADATPETPADEAIAPRVTRTAESLQQSIAELLDALPGAPLRPQELARNLGLKKDLPSRLLRATAQPDPLASIHQMPGPEALRLLVDAAQQQLDDATTLQRARHAIDSYEQLVRDTAGDRKRFDTLLSGWLPEVRERVDLVCRQSVYKGISGIKGIAIDFKFAASILQPSQDRQHVDVAWLIGALGVRRLRDGAPVRFTIRTLNTPDSFFAANDHADNPHPLELDQFIPHPRGRLSAHPAEHLTHFHLESPSLGAKAATNVLFAQLKRHVLHRYETSPQAPRLRGTVAEADLPIRTLLFDTIVHRDLYPDQEPQLIMHDTASRGLASVNDPSRVHDRIEHTQSVAKLGNDLSKLRVAEYPHYTPLLLHTCERLGWDPDAFRAFRCRIDYPLYGSQVHMVFPAPLPPNDDTPKPPSP